MTVFLVSVVILMAYCCMRYLFISFHVVDGGRRWSIVLVYAGICLVTILVNYLFISFHVHHVIDDDGGGEE